MLTCAKLTMLVSALLLKTVMDTNSLRFCVTHSYSESSARHHGAAVSATRGRTGTALSSTRALAP